MPLHPVVYYLSFMPYIPERHPYLLGINAVIIASNPNWSIYLNPIYP